MSEVRRCRHCGEAAAVSVRDWQGTAFFGLVNTGRVPRRDFVCQACGAHFAVEPWVLRLLAGILIAPQMLFIGAVVGVSGLAVVLSDPAFGLALGTLGAVIATASAVFGGWAVGAAWVARTRPVVADAPEPELRYRLSDPVRRCACGQAVPCTQVTANTANGLPTGTEYTYGCDACGREFVVESPWGQIMTMISSTVALGLGALLLSTASGQGAGAWACAAAVALLGVGGWLLASYRLLARFRFPEVPQSELSS